MFDRTYLKLAGFYLLVLAVITFIFSVNIYQLSVGEIKNDLKMHSARLEMLRLPLATKSAMQTEASDQYNEVRSRIIGRLIIINIFILTSGGLLSYYLARWTLKPIEENHKALERFTADASHELRTPIAAMQTETEVSLMNPELNLEEAKAQLESNLEEMQKLTGLTETMLNLASFNETTQVELNSFEVDSIVHNSKDRVKQMAKTKNIKIVSNQVPGMSVLVDRESIEQALVILLENAIKYSSEKSVVNIISETEKGKMNIKVQDFGVGISANDSKYIFDRFYRSEASRAKKGKGGYGLGLAIAKNIVIKNNGKISVESQVSKGSTFTLSLPLTS